jgi:hypothetical protein
LLIEKTYKKRNLATLLFILIGIINCYSQSPKTLFLIADDLGIGACKAVKLVEKF